LLPNGDPVVTPVAETDRAEARDRGLQTLREQDTMRRNTFHPIPALAAVGLLILVGCAGGGDPRSLGPVPTAPSTTAAAATSTVPGPTTTMVGVSTTGARTTTPTTKVEPVRADQPPQVVATPLRAAVGARVTIEGSGFTDENWRAPNAPLWLAGGPSGCYFFAEAEHAVTVSLSGRLSGSFVVPAVGNCRFSTGAEMPVQVGSYQIVYQCTACNIGTFAVTDSPAAVSLRCANVGFTPNSDDVAGSIVATGLSCLDAEDFVRAVGARVGATSGPDRLEQGAFVCIRTARRDGPGLPASDYECTSGARKVTFSRT